jgi:polysaccharide chain length determinant protein (PEP-CTERM system associated)
VLPGRKYKAEDILAVLWRRKWLVLAPLVACSVGTYVVAKRLPDLYRSETLILVVPQKVPESYVRSTVSGRIEDRIQSLKEQILSHVRLERIILDFDLYREARETQSLEAVITAMRPAVKVDTVRGGEAFTVQYVARDPQVAQRVTERLASLFIEENVRDREKLAVGTSDFLQTQLDDARRRLIDQEKKLEQYRLAHAGQLPSQAPFNLQAIQSARLELQALDTTLARARDRQTTLERQLAEVMTPVASAAPPVSPVVSAGTDDPTEPVGATVREQIEDGRRKLAALEARLKPQHPDVVRLRRRIGRLEQTSAAETVTPASPAVSADGPRERRARELRADLDATAREIATRQVDQQRVRDEMNLYQSRLDAAPIREAELTELTRDYETIQQIYRGLLAKREDSKMAANLEQRQIGEQFRVLDPARVPSSPFSPNRMLLNLMGVAVGLAIGLGATAALEYLDSTLKNEDDVRLLLGLPVIATIPELATTKRAPAGIRARLGALVWTWRG